MSSKQTPPPRDLAALLAALRKVTSKAPAVSVRLEHAHDGTGSDVFRLHASHDGRVSSVDGPPILGNALLRRAEFERAIADEGRLLADIRVFAVMSGASSG